MLRLVGHHRLVPLVTTALFLAYEEVLGRPEHQLVHRLDPAAVRRFLGALASACEPVDVRFLWRPQLKDPGDEMVLAAAINGRADALVTHNTRHFISAGSRFRVLTPADLMMEVLE